MGLLACCWHPYLNGAVIPLLLAMSLLINSFPKARTFPWLFFLFNKYNIMVFLQSFIVFFGFLMVFCRVSQCFGVVHFCFLFMVDPSKRPLVS